MQAKIERKITEKLLEKGTTSNIKSRKKLARVTIPQQIKINKRFWHNDIQTFTSGQNQISLQNWKEMLENWDNEDVIYQKVADLSRTPIQHAYSKAQGAIELSGDVDFELAVSQLHHFLHLD